MFGHVTTSVDMETFVKGASVLERVCTRGSREETMTLMFSIFAEGGDTLTEKGDLPVPLLLQLGSTKSILFDFGLRKH